MKSVQCITINTDASFHPESKAAGYAFYIVCDLFKIQKSGMFKRNPVSAMEAEIMCIGNAIATLLAQKELPTAKWLIINNDCTYGMDAIKRSAKGIPRDVNALRQKLIIRLQSSENKMRHVRAHSGIKDARSWVNEWCDTEAKKWMRIAHKKIQS